MSHTSNNNPQMILKVLLPVAIFLLAAGAANGQSAGRVEGMVTDQAGKGIARASVVVLSHAGETKERTLTLDDGRFTLTGLPTGVYRLRVRADGFNQYLQNAVFVRANVTPHVVIRA